jgi:hypothetical protein
MITEAGPPVTKDEAEPMNRPEPMAPPLQSMLVAVKHSYSVKECSERLTWRSFAYDDPSSPS